MTADILEEVCSLNEVEVETLTSSVRSDGIPQVRISMSGNEIDIIEWEELERNASAHEKHIMATYDFYEDGKDKMRVEW